MSRAYTLSYETGLPTEDNPYGDAAAASDTDGDTGDLASLLGGKSGGIGATLGTLAGTGLGGLLGPAGAAIGAGLGKLGGSLIDSAISPKPKPKPAQKRLSDYQRKIIEAGERRSRKTGNPAYAEEAKLLVHNPKEYQRRRDAGQLASQREQPSKPTTTPAQSSQPAPTTSRAPTTSQAPATRTPPAQTRTPSPSPSEPPPRTAPAPRRAAPSEPPPVNVAPPDEPEWPEEEQSWEDEYDDTGAPVAARPEPDKHLSIAPLSDDYMARVLRDMPGMKQLDPRMLRMISGSTGTARDVAGVDPQTGTYHATSSETAYGITKKLTGQVDRVQELLVANPQVPADGSAAIWNIPPGWLQGQKPGHPSPRAESTSSRKGNFRVPLPKSSAPQIATGGASCARQTPTSPSTRTRATGRFSRLARKSAFPMTGRRASSRSPWMADRTRAGHRRATMARRRAIPRRRRATIRPPLPLRLQVSIPRRVPLARGRT